MRKHFWLSACLGLLLACGGAPSPEEEILAVIDTGVRAVEAGDLPRIRQLVSASYADDAGRDRQSVTGLIAVYLRQNPSIHLLTRVRDLRLLSATRGSATVLVAVAGRPIDTTGEPGDLQADLVRVELALEREDGGPWRVRRARWEPAAAVDFW